MFVSGSFDEEQQQLIRKDKMEEETSTANEGARGSARDR
jgi:hypothetical protein